MLANDTIGTGPRLQMLSADETFNDAVETAFMRWSDAVRLAPKLRTMRMARCQDGEAFAVLATNPQIRHGVKLDLQLIEADRVSGELRWFEDDTSVDGISYDRWGNPTDYRVLKYHPRRHPVYAGGRCDPHSGGIHDSHLPSGSSGIASRSSRDHTGTAAVCSVAAI